MRIIRPARLGLEHHLEFRQSFLIDNHECLLLSAEAVNLSRVDIKPEGVDVNPTILMRPHEGIAGDILHLKQSVHHGQFVGDAEFLININVGRVLRLCVEFAQMKWLPEVSLGEQRFNISSHRTASV